MIALANCTVEHADVYNMNLMSNTAASYPMGAGRFEPWLFVNCYREQREQGAGGQRATAKNVLHPLNKKLQYCSSDSCCINKHSYEPLRNHADVYLFS